MYLSQLKEIVDIFLKYGDGEIETSYDAILAYPLAKEDEFDTFVTPEDMDPEDVQRLNNLGWRLGEEATKFWYCGNL